MKRTVGIRNNNPGNIRAPNSTLVWQGQIGVDDHGFCIFDTYRHGLRALGKLLLTYYDKHGLKTVRGIISRWAPPTENNTVSYIAGVCFDMRVDPDVELNLRDKDVLDDIVRAIVIHENGYFPYTARDLVQCTDDVLGVTA